MAAYKPKIPKRDKTQFPRLENQANDKFYHLRPAWNFHRCDRKYWSLADASNQALFWIEILPYLQNIETKLWREILVQDKKQNHTLQKESLNIQAINRLEELNIENASIISLRINATHRLYGYMESGIFNILWYDKNHGNNSDCVCRSYLKHT